MFRKWPVGGLFDPRGDRVRTVQSAFPNDHDGVAKRVQGAANARVAGLVAGDLGSPIVGVGLRSPRAPVTGVAMPETTMDENGEFTCR